MQQFLSVDPLLAYTEQAYAYVRGNPTNYKDPSGQCIGPLVIVCIAVEVAGEGTAGAGIAGFLTGLLGAGAAVTGGVAISQGSNSSADLTDYAYTDPVFDSGGINSIDPIDVTIGASITAGAATCTLQFAQKGKGNFKDSELIKDLDAEARRTGKAKADILDEWYEAARKAKDFDLAKRITKTQKALRTRPSRQSKDR